MIRIFKSASVLAVVAAAVLASTVQADIIELKSGGKLEGTVLKESPSELILDIGVDIIRIPTSEIRERTSTTPDVRPRNETGDANLLYRTADLPTRSIKELTQTFGEGVVLIETPSGLGSGFLIDDKGSCVTNYHVVEKETRVAVTIYHRKDDGQFVRRRIDDVKIQALNPYFDLALLKVPEQSDLKFQPVYLAKASDQREGDEVFAIGNPLGLERSVSQGIISTRNRNFAGIVYLQTTANINPGNSGGPLFNLKGEVVGVINMKIPIGEGLGFAIPVAYLKDFLMNRDAFAFDRNNPNTGYRYFDPPRRKTRNAPPPPDSPGAASAAK
jgi:serine protease Do